MKGTYKFYQNGEYVGGGENVITTEGKRVIMSYLSGDRNRLADGIAVGAFNTAATAADTELALEWARAPITSVSPDYVNTLLIFKARFDSQTAGAIYEAGLWLEDNNITDYPSKILLDFDSGRDTWSGGAFQTSGARVGENLLRLAPGTSATVTAAMDVAFDLSGYSTADTFKLGFISTTNVASMFVRFHTDASNYFTYTITSPGSGYKNQTFNKTNFTTTGSPNWATITSVTLSATSSGAGSSTVDFDLLRIEDRDLNTNADRVLVSRFIPAVFIQMLPNVPMDVEYTLDVTL